MRRLGFRREIRNRYRPVMEEVILAVVFIIVFLMSVYEDVECHCESCGGLETLESNRSSLDAELCLGL